MTTCIFLSCCEIILWVNQFGSKESQLLFCLKLKSSHGYLFILWRRWPWLGSIARLIPMHGLRCGVQWAALLPLRGVKVYVPEMRLKNSQLIRWLSEIKRNHLQVRVKRSIPLKTRWTWPIFNHQSTSQIQFIWLLLHCRGSLLYPDCCHVYNSKTVQRCFISCKAPSDILKRLGMAIYKCRSNSAGQ